METYGDRLKQARIEKGLSRPQLAKLCGISVKTIQNYEPGFKQPNRIDTSQKFAEVLGVTVDYLINGNTDNDDLTEEDKSEILSHASALFAGGKLSEDEQLAFINELQTLYLDAKKRLKDQKESE
jgi:transcriptional regulator with XRE-family HTH domain